jgi:hypothetical protein
MIIFLIVFLSIISLVCAVSVYLNFLLYKQYNSVRDFFESSEEEIHNDFVFFDKLCKTQLLMNDPFVVELIVRLKKTRDKFGSYIKKIEEIKLENS